MSDLRGVIRMLKARENMSPAEQRVEWAREAAASGNTLQSFRFGDRDASRLKVVSMNVYYGQVVDRKGRPSDPAIDVEQYACVFETGADVVAMQEVVLSALPPGSPLANTAETYAERDKPGSDHWKKWTQRFPEALFRSWWNRMKAVAKARGYSPVPAGGCGDAGSMYKQRFGNAVFVHRDRLRDLGLPTHKVECVPELLGKAKLPRYAGESEDRNAIVLDLGRLVLVNTHLSEKHTSSSETGHTTQRDMMDSLLSRLGGARPTLIVGDFNKSDPETVPLAAEQFYQVAYDPHKDRDLYDLLRISGFACLPNNRATAWNARHPDQVCSNFMDAAQLRRAVRVLMPWSGKKVISDHAALAFSIPFPS